MSVTAAEGFVASGCHAGIKRRRYDMALLATEDGKPVPCAAVFTRNKFFAPPVDVSRVRLQANGGLAAAVIVNSGNANAGTGPAGKADAEGVLVCSTGIIGTTLPMDLILAATPKLAKKLSRDGAHDAAKGILTTDHETKEVVVKGSTFTLGGMAKGCGMIAPDMATMLAFLTTDADLPVETLQQFVGVLVGGFHLRLREPPRLGDALLDVGVCLLDARLQPLLGLVGHFLCAIARRDR